MSVSENKPGNLPLAKIILFALTYFCLLIALSIFIRYRTGLAVAEALKQAAGTAIFQILDAHYQQVQAVRRSSEQQWLSALIKGDWDAVASAFADEQKAQKFLREWKALVKKRGHPQKWEYLPSATEEQGWVPQSQFLVEFKSGRYRLDVSWSIKSVDNEWVWQVEGIAFMRYTE